MTIAIIIAGGSGQRMREEIPKRHKAVQEQLRGEFSLSSAAWDEIMTEAKKKAG